MVNDSASHRFNDDLLANKVDRERAKSSYPRLFHVLDYPELRELFTSCDRPTNAAKRRSHRAGLLAIFLGTCALLGASVASLTYSSDLISRVLAIASALAGIVSVFLGLFGVLYGQARQRWLEGRLMTERLRQFHFQIFVCHLPDIVHSLTLPDGVKAYEEARARWFNAFKARYEDHLDAELTEILRGRKGSDVWLHRQTPIDPDTLKADLEDVFEAYKALRIRHQLRYANDKLSPGGSLLSPSLVSLERFLSQTTFVTILILFSLHVAIALGLSILPKQAAAVVDSPWVHVAVIWCAILALAVRALEEGLGVRDEIERYRDYSSSIEAIRDRFDQTKDPAEKLRIMEDMERLSYEEMSSFLRNAHDTRFVM